MNIKNKFNKISVIALLFSFFICVNPLVAIASNSDKSTSEKLLFIVDGDLYDSLTSELAIAANDTGSSVELNNSLYDIIKNDEVTDDIISNYRAVAVNILDSNMMTYVSNAFSNGIIVYLYGGLSISDYKSATNLSDFSLDVDILNYNDSKIGTAYQSFDSTYESDEQFDIIGFSCSALLCKFDNEATTLNYLAAIVNNFSNISVANTRSTVVKSQFNFVTYFGNNNADSVHLDYTLYQEKNESDATYDYFAIKTNSWVVSGSAIVTGVNTKYSFPFSTSELLETGPASQSSIGSLSVSVGFGSRGASGTVGYTVDLSSTKPTIKRSEDYTNDIVEWKMTRSTGLSTNLKNTPLTCCASWASKGSYAGIDVYYQGTVNIGTNNQYPVSSSYTKVPVRFTY